MSKAESIGEVEVITFNPNAATVAAFSQTEQDLAALEAKHLNVHYPVETAEELAIAETALKEVKKYRTTLEAHRKSIKDPVLSYGKLIDSEAKRLNERILKIETPLQTVIDAKKAEAERARQAAEQAALERLQEFDRMIDAIKAYPAKQAGKTAAEMQDALVILHEREPHIGKYFEKTGEALDAHIDAVKELGAMVATRKQHEADQAELEALRKQQAEAAAEAKRKADEQAAALAAALAAMQKQIDEANAELARQAAETQRLADEQANLDKKNADTNPQLANAELETRSLFDANGSETGNEVHLEPQATQATEAQDQAAHEASKGAVYGDAGALRSVIADLVAACQAALNERPNLDCAWMLQDAIEGAKSI